MTTKTGIVLAWGGMSFIDTWPNINSVCDLPGLFGGNFWCGGFCRCSLLFLGGGGGGGGGLVVIVFVVVVLLIVVVVLLVWLLLFLGCCCLAVSVCFLFFFVVVVVVVFLFFVGHSTPKGKNETKVCFPVFWGPLSPFPFFCSCLLIFLVVSFFSFLIGISRCCLHGCAKTTR